MNFYKSFFPMPIRAKGAFPQSEQFIPCRRCLLEFQVAGVFLHGFFEFLDGLGQCFFIHRRVIGLAYFIGGSGLLAGFFAAVNAVDNVLDALAHSSPGWRRRRRFAA